MKILLVGNYLPDRQDSMHFYARMLERGLRARGHSVLLIQPPKILGALARDSSRMSSLPMHWPAKWLGYADKFLFFRGQLRRAAAQADIVHICDHSNAMYVPLLHRFPLVVTCHDILAIRSAMGHFPQNRVGVSGRIFQRLIARGLRQAPSILCVSDKTRHDLETCLGISKTRLHVVPNALHWPYAPLPEQERRPLLAALGLETDEKYFLHVGGNHWYKNRAAAISIFVALRAIDRYKNTRLVMAGAAMTTELLAIARQHNSGDALIEVTGPSNVQLQALYSGAIATLFPSLEEGFGWPIVEAQACGCPVATTNRPPMNEIGGDAAILINPEQPTDAASRIAEALLNRAELRAKGLRNALRFDENAMLDACEALYRSNITAGAAQR